MVTVSFDSWATLVTCVVLIALSLLFLAMGLTLLYYRIRNRIR